MWFLGWAGCCQRVPGWDVARALLRRCQGVVGRCGGVAGALGGSSFCRSIPDSEFVHRVQQEAGSRVRIQSPDKARIHPESPQRPSNDTAMAQQRPSIASAMPPQGPSNAPAAPRQRPEMARIEQQRRTNKPGMVVGEYKMIDDLRDDHLVKSPKIILLTR